MKEYNRKTKRWEEKSTEKVGDLKKEKLCKGHRPHDMQLVLPPYLYHSSPEPELTPNQIKKYYAIEDARTTCNDKFDMRLAELGINKRSGWAKFDTRHYKCANCGKKK